MFFYYFDSSVLELLVYKRSIHYKSIIIKKRMNHVLGLSVKKRSFISRNASKLQRDLHRLSISAHVGSPMHPSLLPTIVAVSGAAISKAPRGLARRAGLSNMEVKSENARGRSPLRFARALWRAGGPRLDLQMPLQPTTSLRCSLVSRTGGRDERRLLLRRFVCGACGAGSA